MLCISAYCGEDFCLYGTIYSLIPFFIVIPFAMLTKQVIPGLVVGLCVGSYMLHPTPIGGLQATLGYIIQECAVPDNLRLIVFLYGFGAFVGLIRVTGGISGFAAWMAKRIRTVRGAFTLTWVSSLATFMAPDFRIITIAPIVKNVFERLGVPARRVAYIIDLTSTPLCAIVPIGTAFVGYMIGLITTSLQHHGAGASPYGLLIASLPFNLFSWVMLAWGLYVSFFSKAERAGKTEAIEAKKSRSGRVLRGNAAFIQRKVRQTAAMANVEAGEMGVVNNGLNDGLNRDNDADKFPDVVELVSKSARPNAWNLLFPLALLLFLTLFFTWWDGRTHAAGILGAFIHANAAKAMLEALLVTLIVAIVYYAIRRQPLDRTMFGFMAGGNEMMGVIVLLVFIWGVSAVSADLGFSVFTKREIAHYVPASLIVPAFFVFGCCISYVIGSTFGTWGMLMPLGFSLASAGVGQLPIIAGAVFASGTFGGFASPLSDNTVAMATVMKLPVMDYARHKTKTAIWAALVCTVLYAVLGFWKGI
jgi:tetracycline resistance efflux pump